MSREGMFFEVVRRVFKLGHPQPIFVYLFCSFHTILQNKAVEFSGFELELSEYKVQGELADHLITITAPLFDSLCGNIMYVLKTIVYCILPRRII